MEGLEEASSTSSKMDQHDGTPEPVDESDVGIVNIKLPEQLQKITPSEEFVSVRHRWNTNEEIASILIAFDRHKEWLVLPQKIRPPSGSMLLYNRKVVFYRRDGYCWKKRRNGSTIREDHMKLKVQGLECIYGSYVHSAILPTFHRRCYWLLQNPNIVLIHYLNVPYPEAAKPSLPSLSYELRQKEWSKEELVDQLRPMLSRAAQGIEHDAEEDQKVEKMLEEILPMLMPMQENTKFITSRPLAPAPAPTKTSPSSFLTSPPNPPASGSLKRPIRNQALQPQTSQQVEQQSPTLQQIHAIRTQAQATSRVTTLQSPLLSSQTTTHSQQSLQQQQTPVQIPAVHSLTHPLIQNSQIAVVTTTSHIQNFNTTSLSQNSSQNGQVVHQNSANTDSSSFLNQVSENSTTTARFITVENDVSMTNSPMPMGEDNHVDSGSSAFISHTAQNLPVSCQAYPSCRTSASAIISLPGNQSSSFPVNSLTAAARFGKVTTSSPSSSSSMSINYLQNQESHQQISGSHQHSPLQQQNAFQLIAQHNHSFVQTPMDTQHQIKLTHHLQQQQPLPQHAPPVLTLHLKPTNGSLSDSPGFVLSLQGATIISQHNDQSSGFSNFDAGSAAQTVNLTNSQGVVLVASPSPAGNIVLNRISPNPQNAAPVSTFVTPHNTTAPGAPPSQSAPSLLLSPFTQPSHQNMNPSHFTGSLAPMTTSVFSTPGNTASPVQSFIYSSPPTTNRVENVHHPSLLHQHQQNPAQHQDFANMFATATTTTSATINAFPMKVDNDMFSVSSNDEPFKEDFLLVKKDEPVDENSSAHSLSFNHSASPGASISTFGNSVMTEDTTHPIFTGAFHKMRSESSPGFSLQLLTSQPPQPGHTEQASTHMQQHHHHHQSHQLETSDLMAGPSGLNSSVKDMITNPNSCDTLDGSFPSLPSADLNLDDLLDLNDLDDVSDLGCSPFTPSDLSEQPISSTDMTEKGEDDSNSDMNLMTQGQSSACLNDNLSSFSCLTSTLAFQNHQQVHQAPPSLHRSPASPLHPGAPPRPMTVTAFGALLLSSLPQGDPSPLSTLSCDKNNHTQGGHEEVDPELNSVIKDFSPDWAYTRTNTKILVAGPWFSENSHYTCVFDGEHIPASLLQPGLLRCYTQYHSPGYVTLQVARDGVVISNCEVFEFCDRESHDSNTTHPEWFAIDSNQLKLLLVEKLDQLRLRFVNIQPPFQDSISDDMETLETALVQQVQSMASQAWSDSNLYPKAGQHNLTLLHLAAGLGFAKLISCLIRWRMNNRCVALEFEVDAQSVDSHACTPLMWACALGKIDAALTLYHWNASPLKMCNKDGHLPLTLARQKGHYNLANQVEQLERAKEQQQHLKEQHRQQQQLQTHSMNLTCLPSASTSGHAHNQSPGLTAAGASRDHGKDDSELKDEMLDIRINPPLSFPKPGKPGPKLLRRFSEQMIGHQSRSLSKRNSVDLLPSGQDIDHATLPSLGSPLGQPIREANSEPQLPVSPDMAFVAPPAPRLLLEDEIDEPSAYSGEASTSKMDTDEVVSVPSGSPIIDVERISSDEEVDANKDGSKHQMVTLANQIIAAIPERIKLSPSKADEGDDTSSGRGRSESHSSLPSQGSPRPSSFGDDSGISTPMTDSLAFEEYRYPEFGTPASSLSPDSTCLPSPYSPYSFTLDSPPPTTAEFTEYFNAPTTYMEKDFSQLTLSDQEQRKLYEAAKVIQNAYRHYRDKQQQQQQLQQQKEIEAAILIQSYYRRYKTYAYYKKMSHAAVLIQNQFRTYYAKRKKRGDTGATTRRESERLKKGRNQSVIIQQRFRSHYQRRSLDGKEGSGQVQGSGDAPDRPRSRSIHEDLMTAIFSISSPPPQETSSQYQEGTPPTDAEADSSAVKVSANATAAGEESCAEENACALGTHFTTSKPSSDKTSLAVDALGRSEADQQVDVLPGMDAGGTEHGDPCSRVNTETGGEMIDSCDVTSME